jgi:hypothetical protein
MADHLHAWAEDLWAKGGFKCVTCGREWGSSETRHVVVAMREELPDRQRRVYDVLKDGEWHDGPELTHPAVGGSEGLRRLRELRAKGYTIEMRRKAKGRTTRQYRLVR